MILLVTKLWIGNMASWVIDIASLFFVDYLYSLIWGAQQVLSVGACVTLSPLIYCISIPRGVADCVSLVMTLDILDLC